MRSFQNTHTLDPASSWRPGSFTTRPTRYTSLFEIRGASLLAVWAVDFRGGDAWHATYRHPIYVGHSTASRPRRHHRALLLRQCRFPLSSLPAPAPSPEQEHTHHTLASSKHEGRIKKRAYRLALPRSWLPLFRCVRLPHPRIVPGATPPPNSDINLDSRARANAPRARATQRTVRAWARGAAFARPLKFALASRPLPRTLRDSHPVLQRVSYHLKARLKVGTRSCSELTEVPHCCESEES
jgi:hypothetical protein